MTACTNNGGKARRVVTAALVGVLSVGAVPAIALATGSDVSLQAEDPAVLAGADIVYKKGQPGDVYYANGKQQGLVPSEIDPAVAGIDNIEVTSFPSKAEVGAYYYFYVNLGSTTGKQFHTVNGSAGVKYDAGDKGMVQVSGELSFTMPSDAGTYAVVVGQYNGAAGWDFVNVADTFTIASYSLADATLIDGSDVTDTTFDWTGERNTSSVNAWWGRLNVEVDGHVLVKDNGSNTSTADYQLNIREKGGATSVTSGQLDPDKTYVAVITGINGYAGQSKPVEFTVGKLNLSDAVITPVVDTATPSSSSTIAQVAAAINDVESANYADALSSDVEIVFGTDPNGDPISSGDEGKYTFTIKATKDSKWVEGEQTVTVVKADRLANINFTPCGTTTDGTNFTVDLGAEKPVYFDLNRVSVKDGTDDVDYTFEIKDDEGNTYADDSALRNPGTYYVTVNAWEYVNGDLVAQSKTAKVVVKYDNVTEADNIFFVYDGKNYAEGETATDEYDGTDLSEKVSVTVKVGDKTLVEGTDYDVTVERSDADGGWTKVDSIVDAGDYTITVTGKSFNETAKFSLHVDPMTFSEVKVDADLVDKDGTGYLAYTSEVLTPTFSFYKDGVEVEVPAEAYEVTYTKDKKETELKEVGTYTPSFEGTAKGANYDFTKIDTVHSFEVTDKKVFLDVPMNEWYSQGVYDAAKLGYMNGEGNGATFGPMRELTRAEAACVLFNMAGGDDMYPDATVPGYDVHEKVYNTDYTDVEGNEFFAKAIAWCKATEIINGYADGTFGVSRFVTNEEFACMLANYAKAKNEYKAVDADETLAAYPDASVVSDWAKDAVAWCVSEGIMGGGANISPAGFILRMRAATMAVNAQPEKLTDLVIDVTPDNPKPGYDM
ncbi:S-layer homology domain-containing protein [Olsenella sp. An293]|uniref:S-layer homology domain-containing protein n=1 Tax=Olsenella sp. An293 TaxID=1965626 RepID=UPI000B578A7F|nr:S-layer homology domain-containing protein [Olsenella sp. An293]OUO33044.1 hypothetical protein B5F85_03070 [Olsenella sp. An293]